ncbi:uncharacterized protein LOC119766876 [Culex quinquefasciatus]|uniref:uncharacterized protein LOC119766876 n=1 Tax=Culex quinquefasciatus TaxID=7176 RepID=UPI0018E30A98|nr:uncharacterized protein LOC119766876 [Culex quinquefasciatus]
MAKELAARRRKMLASGGCYSPPYEGCSSEGVAATGGCRIGVPLIGEDIQYGGGDCGGKRSAAELKKPSCEQDCSDVTTRPKCEASQPPAKVFKDFTFFVFLKQD